MPVFRSPYNIDVTPFEIHEQTKPPKYSGFNMIYKQSLNMIYKQTYVEFFLVVTHLSISRKSSQD